MKILKKLLGNANKYYQYYRYNFLINKANNLNDSLKSIGYLELSARQGFPKACYELALVLEQFDYYFIKQDGLESFRNKLQNLLQLAANANYIKAQYLLATYYWTGKYGFPINFRLAHDWFTIAARAKDRNSFCNLGIMYLRGDGVAKDYKKAAKIFKLSEDMGNNLASLFLAKMYEYGQGFKKSKSKAYKYYKEAANADLVDGIYELARCYDKGYGTAKNYQKAFEYYSKAATMGLDSAKLKLAEYYIYGRACKKHPIKAEYLLKEVALKGDPEAQFKLASFYENTSSSLQNYKKSYEWYLKAAKQGYTKAQINLAALYLRGEGALPSDETAKFWLEIAANEGDQIAQYNLKQLKIANLDNILELAFGGSERVLH